MSLKPKESDKLIPLFGGFCFFLSAIELMIPKPVPFFRIGLANLPILLGIDIFSFPAFCALLFIKVLGQAIISGTLFSYVFLFSLLGTFGAGLLMYSMRGIPRKAVSFIGISIAGAFISNFVQTVLAILFIFGKSARYIIPPLFFAGIITSFFLGLFANEFTQNSSWYENIINGKFKISFLHDYGDSYSRKSETKKLLPFNEKYLRCGSGIVLFLLLLFTDFLAVKTIVFGASLILCTADRQKINFTNLIVMFTVIIIFNLFPPAGKIVFGIFGFEITSEALLRGIEKAVILEGMIYISKWALNTEFNFKSKFGKTVSASLNVFQKLLSVKNEINPKNLIPTLDAILLSM
ncbi:Gx transporter family protein [Treponema pedis]|uniref:Heptaprenyl diphosphate synthase component I n=1 Tax=Treponema pedis str. T A4 TaxID=1291379 RepID=S5ZMA4_9SPIR|nr:Gx transporter family protein [Treponema pedis]AGT43727.1 hypothetical protein TPE_1232 [Treponema pedis str. T A4]